MPLYEYHCQSCNQDFEKMVRMSEADKLPECPHCKSGTTHKKISVFATRGVNSSLSTSAAGGGGSCSSSSPFR